MFQSQFSNQKAQSGNKQGNQNPDTITTMTIRMLKKNQISQDKKDVVYEDKIINYIQIIARTHLVEQQQQKGIFILNDDTGYQQFSINFSSELDKKIFEILNDKDEFKQIYYCFLFRARINRDTIQYDVQNIQKVQDSGQILLNILQIINQSCRNNNTQNILQKNEQTQNFSTFEEEQEIKQQKTLEDKILDFMRTESKENGTNIFNQQVIVNRFISEQETLKEIKKCIGKLIQSGNLQQGQGLNNYLLAD